MRQLKVHGKGRHRRHQPGVRLRESKRLSGRDWKEAGSFAFLAGKGRVSTPLPCPSQPPFVEGDPQLSPESADSRYALPVATFRAGSPVTTSAPLKTPQVLRQGLSA